MADCLNCHQPIPNNATVCPWCGADEEKIRAKLNPSYASINPNSRPSTTDGKTKLSLKTRILLSGLMVLVGLGAMYSNHLWPKSIEVKDEGDTVYVNGWEAERFFAKEQGPLDYEFLVVGEGLNDYRYSRLSLPVIPMNRVRQLTQSYGDFRRCNSPGASAGMNSTIEVRLIPRDNAADEKIQAISDRKDLDDSQIRIHATKLTLVKSKEHWYAEREGMAINAPPYEDYLVEDIDVPVKQPPIVKK